jgi:uncharacterized membrane protein YhaH (DUF805 family)
MHWMIMPFKRYADFSGRSQRKEFWMFILFNLMIILPLFIFIGMQSGAREKATDLKGSAKEMADIGVIVLMLYIAAIIVPLIAVAVRRFHDQGRSGWFVLLSFIPYVGLIVMVTFMALDGTPGPNRYGPDPKGRYSVGNDDDGDIDHFSTIDFSSGAPATPPARIVR